MRVGQRCGSCKRPMRPFRAKREEWPGTVGYHAHGLCNSCDKARRGGGAPGRRRPYGVMPERCVICRRGLRHSSVLVKDAPDTVSYAGHGRCSRCERRPDKPRQEYRVGVVPCRGCGYPTRPGRGKAADYPGTVVRKKAGFCNRCVRDGTAEQVLKQAAAVERWRNRKGQRA